MSVETYLETLSIIVLGIVTVGLGDSLKDPWMVEAGKLLFGAAVGYFSAYVRQGVSK